MKVRTRRSQDWFWLDNETIDTLGQLGPYALATYVVLARIANDDALSAFPSVDAIAKSIGMSSNTLRSSIKTLKKRHIIDVESRLAPDGGADTNEHFLLDPQEWTLDLPESEKHERHFNGKR